VIGDSLQGARAGVVSRFLTLLIDSIVAVVTIIGGYMAVSGVLFMFSPRNFRFPNPSAWLISVIAFIVVVVYLTSSWHISGRTLGQQVMGLRVLSTAGRRLGFDRALARAILCAAFPAGLFWSAFSRRNASIQDLIVRTAVVYDWESHRSPSVVPAGPTPVDLNR
jgi:uncharacterized RDD family membrane protein YckC